MEEIRIRLIYMIKENQSYINIFNTIFVDKYKLRFKILYRNKIHKLIDILKISTEKETKEIKVEIINI